MEHGYGDSLHMPQETIGLSTAYEKIKTLTWWNTSMTQPHATSSQGWHIQTMLAVAMNKLHLYISG